MQNAQLTPDHDQRQGPPPFIHLRPVTLRAPILFASPHSGSYYPPQLEQSLSVSLMDLRRTEDAFVDKLFEPAVEAGCHVLQAQYGRSYVDLNRDARELDASMFRDGAPRMCGLPGPRVRAGLGALPRVGASGKEIYAELISRDEGSFRLDVIHDTYHAAIGETLEAFKLDCSDVVLIDCHSMPSRHPGRNTLPDIVLGDRFGSSCSPKLTSQVERACRKAGLSTGRNAPFAGGYTTRRYGRPRRGVHVLQIEINRRLYLDEARVEPHSGFTTLLEKMTGLIESVIEFAHQENE